MAKQIQGNEIIQDDHLGNAADSGRELISVYKELDKMLLNIIDHAKLVAKSTTIGSVSEIKKVTEAYNQTNAATKAAIELDKQLKAADDEVVKGKIRLQQANAEQRKLLKEQIALEDKYIGSLKKAQIENAKLRRERENLNLETKEGAVRLKEINTQIDKNNARIKQSADLQKKQSLNVGNYKSAITGLNGALGQLGIGLSVFALMRDAFKTVVDFDKATQSLSAITGATGKDLENLKGKIADLSGEMRVGITDTTKLFEIVGSQMPQYLSDAGGLQKISESSIILSRAANDTIENSTLALTSLLNQFSLGAEDAERAMNVLAAGSLVGSVGITQLSESMKNAGSVLAGANVSIEESVALLEVLGKFGVIGAEAGTKLRGSMLKLQQAGIGYASGQFNINDALAEANERLNSYSTQLEKDAFLQKTFGAENISTGRILLSNIKLFDEYTQGVTGTNVATEQAAINSDTLSTKLDEMNAAWENAIIEINSGSGAGEGFKELIAALTELIPVLVRGVSALAKEMASYLGFVTDLVKATEKLDGSWESIVDLFESSYRLLIRMLPFGKQLLGLWDDLADSSDDLTDAQRRNNLVNEKALEYGRKILQQNREEISDVSVLIDALADENTTREEKNEIIAKLQADYPDILANYDLEAASIENLIALKKQLITQLLNEAIERKKAEQVALFTDKIIALELQKIGAGQSGIAEMDRQIKELYATLPLIEQIAQKVSDNVESTVSGMDLSVAFRDTNDEIERLQFRIQELKSELTGTTEGQRRNVINEQIEIATQELNKLLGIRQKMLDDALDKEEESINKTVSSVGKETVKTAKDTRTELDKMGVDWIFAPEKKLQGVDVSQFDPKQDSLTTLFIDQMIRINEEAARLEQEALQRRKEMYQESLDLLKRLTEAQIEQYDLRIDKEKESAEASKETIDYLREQAAAGNVDAANSLKAEQIALAQQELEIERLEKKRANLLITVAGLEAVSQKLNSGDSNAFKTVGQDIADFLAGLPKFYEGTEGTVAEALGRPHLNTSKDAYMARLDGKEMVLNGDKVGALRAAGLNTTSDVANAALSYSTGFINNRSLIGADMLIVSKLASVEKTLEKGFANMPDNKLDWDPISKSLIHTIKEGSRITKNHFKSGGLFS